MVTSSLHDKRQKTYHSRRDALKLPAVLMWVGVNGSSPFDGAPDISSVT